MTNNPHDFFSLYLDYPEWILLAVLILSAVATLIARFLPIWRTARTARAQRVEAEQLELPTDRTYPLLSVIVYAFTPEEELLSYLATIMSQDYPNYEVILVNEGNSESSSALAERLRAIYPDRLYVTFIPPESHNLSRRKLAQTIGMKAAKGEMVLTTASNCSIPSSSWLSLMMQPFCMRGDIDVVLGYSHMRLDNLSGPGKWFRQFDATLTACQWIGAAVNHYPYRGDGYNLMYRRSLFFQNKGYAKTLHLVDGDDDLFVNDISDSTNTDVMIAPEAILTYDWGESGNRIARELKERYWFTSKMLPRWAFFRAGLGSATQWTAVAAAVGASLAPLPDLLPMIIAVAILLLLFGVEIFIYRRAARALGSVCLFWALPVFLLWLPINNAAFKWRIRRHRKKHFTFS